MKNLILTKRNLLYALCIVVVMPLLSLANVQMSVRFGGVIDRMMIGTEFTSSLVLYIGVASAAYLLDKLVLAYFLYALSNGLVTELHGALTEKLLTMDYKSLQKYDKADLFQSCSKDIYEIKELSVLQGVKLVTGLITGILAAIELAVIHPMYPLVAAVIYVISLLAAKPLGKQNERYSRGVRESEKKLTGIFFDLIDHFLLLKSFGRVEDTLSRLGNVNDDLNENTVRSNIFRNFFKTLTRVINSIAPVAIVFLSVRHFAEGKISAGQIVAAVSLVTSICAPIQNFGELFIVVKKTWFKIKAIHLVLCEPDEKTDDSYEITLCGDITFHHVSYECNGVKILSNVSFTIPSGKTTAVIGKTGSGKTAAMNFISGLTAPTEGWITVGDERITDDNRTALRKSVSTVPSTTYFVGGTLQENLELGSVDSALLEQQKAALHIEKLADGLPNGYETNLVAGSVQLSGGQQKLVGLARGLSVNRNIVLLDEVTTGLDEQSAARVMEHILNEKNHRTVVMITHDLSYIERVDHIIFFGENKRVIEGSHRKLLKNCEEYRGMFA